MEAGVSRSCFNGRFAAAPSGISRTRTSWRWTSGIRRWRPTRRRAWPRRSKRCEQTIPEHKRRRRVRRKPSQERFPEHIVRYEVEAEASEEETHCPEHGQRKLIGYDTTETLEIERPKLRVRVTKYPKFVCEGSPECGVASPERPTGLVEGNRYDTSVAAEVITAKYGFHMPTYRQQDYFAGGGWTPARSTLLNLSGGLRVRRSGRWSSISSATCSPAACWGPTTRR